MIKNNKGFTLVELMVVLLIIGILVAIAVPTFLGIRARAFDSEAKQAVSNIARSVAADWASERTMPAIGVVDDETAYNVAAGTAYPATAITAGKVNIVYDSATGKIGALSQSGRSYQAQVSTTNGSITAVAEDTTPAAW